MPQNSAQYPELVTRSWNAQVHVSDSPEDTSINPFSCEYKVVLVAASLCPLDLVKANLDSTSDPPDIRFQLPIINLCTRRETTILTNALL